MKFILKNKIISILAIIASIESIYSNRVGCKNCNCCCNSCRARNNEGGGRNSSHKKSSKPSRDDEKLNIKSTKNNEDSKGGRPGTGDSENHVTKGKTDIISVDDKGRKGLDKKNKVIEHKDDPVEQKSKLFDKTKLLENHSDKKIKKQRRKIKERN